MTDDDHTDDIAHLAEELDASGADERIEALDDSARELSERIGIPVEPSYVPFEIPVDASVTRGTYPDGTPFTSYASFTRRDDLDDDAPES